MELTRRWLATIPLIAGVVTGAATRGDPVPECVVAREWVAENRASLPTTLAEFSKYRHPYRKAIYTALPREVKMRLWHEQFTHYRNSTLLTPNQKEFLAEVETEFDVYFGPERVVEAEARYKNRSLEVLGFTLTRQIFTELGVNVPESAEGYVAPKSGVGTCECATTSDWCNPMGPGCFDPSQCSETDDGCGWWLCHRCNGNCAPAT